MSASETPAGLPPERNREAVLEARKVNREGREGPAPTAYHPLEAATHYSQHPTRQVGRWAATSLGGHVAPHTGDHGHGFFADHRQSPAKVTPGYTPGGSPPLRRSQDPAGALSRSPPDRFRTRDEAEEAIDRIRQSHQLLAAGAQRTISGKMVASGGDGSIGSKLRERLDGSLQRASDLFRGFDSSWDGLISRDEFKAALKSLEIYTTDEEFEVLFDEVDADGSGEVDFKELRRHLMHKKGSREDDASNVPAVRPGRIATPRPVWPIRNTGAAAWTLNSGRDRSIEAAQGVEPFHRRSLGPGAYEPRMGADFVKPSVSVGGDTGRYPRDGSRFMTLPGGYSAIRGIPDDDARYAKSVPEPSVLPSAKSTSPNAAAHPKATLVTPVKSPPNASPGSKSSTKKSPPLQSGNMAIHVLRSKRGVFTKPAAAAPPSRFLPSQSELGAMLGGGRNAEYGEQLYGRTL